MLSDEAWAWLEPRLPDRTPRRGGRWRDHRQVIEAIAWKYRTGAAWRAGDPAAISALAALEADRLGLQLPVTAGATAPPG